MWKPSNNDPWPLYFNGLALFSSSANIVSFPLAQTGEGIAECELISWFVKEGDVVHEFDKLCEVQSDKASVEITSRYSGTIVKLYHNVGDVVKTGATLLDINTAAATLNVDRTVPGAVASPTLFPATPAPSAPSPTPPLSTSAPPSCASDTTSRSNPDDKVLSSPAVRRMAREAGVDLILVPATGPGGRVTKEDLTSYLQSQQAPAAAAPPKAPPTTAAPTAADAPRTATAVGESTRVPIKGYRRAMVKSMTAVLGVPHFHFADEVVMDPLMAVRAAMKTDPTVSTLKLTYLPLIIKTLSLAISRHPIINSSLAPGEQELLLHPSHNIGIAMATPQGLVVPNIKNVQSLSVLEVARELARLQELAAAGKLESTDISGGTVTVSNIGTIGGLYGLPLVNLPESAIVALGRTQLLPRYNEQGAVVPRSIMHICWGADHRVVDGATLAAFSADWRRLMEEPGRLLLHLR